MPIWLSTYIFHGRDVDRWTHLPSFLSVHLFPDVSYSTSQWNPASTLLHLCSLSSCPALRLCISRLSSYLCIYLFHDLGYFSFAQQLSYSQLPAPHHLVFHNYLEIQLKKKENCWKGQFINSIHGRFASITPYTNILVFKCRITRL